MKTKTTEPVNMSPNLLIIEAKKEQLNNIEKVFNETFKEKLGENLWFTITTEQTLEGITDDAVRGRVRDMSFVLEDSLLTEGVFLVVLVPKVAFRPRILAQTIKGPKISSLDSILTEKIAEYEKEQ